MNFYVYGFYEPDTSEPFYIGKGSGNRINVHFQHRNVSKTPLINKLESLGSIKPCVHIFDSELSEDAAFELEKQLIRKFGLRSEGGSLLNQTTGGEGFSGGRHSDSHKLRMSERMKGNKHSLGVPNACRKPIVCKYYGLEIKRYACIKDTEKDGFKCTNIVKVLKGKKKTAYNYQWEYL